MWEPATIYNQNPSILGWSCGNLVGSTNDVARFFYDLCDPDTNTTLLSPASKDEMQRMQLLTTGWQAGRLDYGAGIMRLDPDRNKQHFWSKGPRDWGYTPSLRAGWSVVMNSDASENYAAY